MQKLFPLLFFIFSYQLLSAQGCSDAGFCTMGAMRPNQHFRPRLDVRLRSVEITQFYAYTKFGDNMLSSIVDLNLGISSKTSVHIKLPYTFIWGRLPANQGFGDVSLSLTYTVFSSERFHLNATLGTKIPPNQANQTHKDSLGTERSYTTYYQTSLGTYDIIAGLSLTSRNWLFAIGYQQALTRNSNQFIKTTWSDTQFSDRAFAYPNSKEIIRGIDGMFRIERNQRFSRLNTYLGILGIYRFTPDIYENENQVRKSFPETQGITLNLITGAGYQFSAKTGVKLMGGFKLYERERNADGLSRDVVFTLSFERRF
ncbi:MAG: hypothetical protein H7Y04_05385 [Verrucomicrobia bacterium]|nr:hypothetical protein [Cytophagales bacterium]